MRSCPAHTGSLEQSVWRWCQTSMTGLLPFPILESPSGGWIQQIPGRHCWQKKKQQIKVKIMQFNYN
jgi:hypothetical protein